MTLKAGLPNSALVLAAGAVSADEFRMQAFLAATAATTQAFEQMAATRSEATDGEVQVSDG